MIHEATERVRLMEMYFDKLLGAVNTDPDLLKSDDTVKEMLNKLKEYCESGMWLKDYELDEKGLFPEGLKRGVLSQDALYDFFENVNDVLNEIKKRG